ncbi:hypothetical protein [Eggerthella sinensis]|uniref:hypothetical protein n=1 Tax=Eggerthella sinensis TaxID=242230 RepID=UPI001D07CF3E|nr:hypothetical protein [Eggerthella sinensis]MCB7037717.1 hypothetical protein [Eggerthella sinensis]
MGARNRVSIGLALCAVLTGGVLVAGCSAAPAETYETPYYALQLPADLAASCVIEYDDYARTMDDGSGEIGHTTSVLDGETGAPLFFVVCGPDSFGPDEDDPRSVKLGEPSQLPGANVYVGQLMFGPDGETTDPHAEEYASFVTVR